MIEQYLQAKIDDWIKATRAEGFKRALEVFKKSIKDVDAELKKAIEEDTDLIAPDYLKGYEDGLVFVRELLRSKFPDVIKDDSTN